MKNLMNVKTLVAVSTFALLSACGGGSGGGSGSAGNTSNTGTGSGTAIQTTGLPMAAALENILTTQGTYSATSVDGINTLSLTITPSESEQFSQSTLPSKKVNLNRVVRQNGAVIDTQQMTIYFNTSPFKFIAVDGREIEKSNPIPVAADVNSSYVVYTSAGVGRGLSSIPPLEGTLSIEQVNNKVYLCLTNKLGNGLLSMPSFETTTISTYCIGINADGKTSGFKASFSTDERTTLRNNVIDTYVFQ